MSDSPSVEEQLREWVGQLAPEHRQLLLMMLTEDDQLQGLTWPRFRCSQLRLATARIRLGPDGRDRPRVVPRQPDPRDRVVRHTGRRPSIVPVLPCSCCGRDVTPSDLYRIYFGERPPSVEVAIGRLILMDMDVNAQFPLPADNEITIGRVDRTAGSGRHRPFKIRPGVANLTLSRA